MTEPTQSISQSSNKTIAKNTLILYVRMFITMGIGMWTSRIVLNALGFTDQGLYNLVGGFVGMLSLLTRSINISFSRFLTYEIGRGDCEGVSKIFRNAATAQWILALIIILLAETIGLWFVHNKMIIPSERMSAVLIVYQLSVLSFVLELISTAQGALVIAYEKMNVFAGISIVTSIVKFAIAVFIANSNSDRLIIYAALLTLLSFCTRIFYTIYCQRTFPFIKLGFSFDRSLFSSIFSFAGWNSISSAAVILRNSGTSVLLNWFGGPIANTINGIANMVNVLATMFVNDFTTAYTPQITKKYASNDSDLTRFLHQCLKFSYCLLLVMAIPIMVNIEPLLIFWLKKIPEGTVIFVRLIILYSLIECVSRPLATAKYATGQTRNYQIVVGVFLLLTIPLSYTFLKIGLPIYFSYIAIIIMSVVALFARIWFLKGAIFGWNPRMFFLKVIMRCLASTLVALLLPLLIHCVMANNIWSTLLQCFIGFLWCCLCVYFVACNIYERKFFQKVLLNLLIHLKLINKY